MRSLPDRVGIPAWWPWAPSRDPSTTMFRRIRWSLTAWYTAVLGATLVIAGVVLYLGVQHQLLSPVDDELTTLSAGVTTEWQLLWDQSFPLPVPCPADESVPMPQGVLWACYDSQEHLIREDQSVSRNPHFLDLSAAQSAVQNGSAWDTVHTHSPFAGTDSSVRRYAVRVVDPRSRQLIGVFEVGYPIGDRINALNELLKLLIICGALGLLAAAVGGMMLAARALEPARRAYLRQQDFIADASHELRTPLTLMRADAEVLLRDRAHLSEDQTAILQDVVQEVSHMGALANNMLDLARLDAGKLRLEKEVVDLTALARTLAHRAEALAGERAVRVRAEPGEPVLVIGDPVLLEHVALILVDNAIKYNHPGGEVVLRTRLEGDQAVLEVADTGIGISAENLPHLGQRFYRVDKARSREAGGAGLGVSIAQSIAVRHDGSLSYSSELDHGTLATLSLPAAQRTAALAGV
ncbi:MAG TPA: ATP-binding protein [Chloroflexota bacterium]